MEWRGYSTSPWNEMNNYLLWIPWEEMAKWGNGARNGWGWVTTQPGIEMLWSQAGSDLGKVRAKSTSSIWFKFGGWSIVGVQSRCIILVLTWHSGMNG
jgi:hypothetical protein